MRGSVPSMYIHTYVCTEYSERIRSQTTTWTNIEASNPRDALPAPKTSVGLNGWEWQHVGRPVARPCGPQPIFSHLATTKYGVLLPLPPTFCSHHHLALPRWCRSKIPVADSGERGGDPSTRRCRRRPDVAVVQLRLYFANLPTSPDPREWPCTLLVIVTDGTACIAWTCTAN